VSADTDDPLAWLLPMHEAMLIGNMHRVPVGVVQAIAKATHQELTKKVERLTRERDEAVAQCDYSAEDMRAYAAASIEQAVARERERIAKECNDTADAYRKLFRKEALAGDPAVVADRFAAYAIALDDMARAIRATT
jgi:hypothetical protein